MSLEIFKDEEIRTALLDEVERQKEVDLIVLAKCISENAIRYLIQEIHCEELVAVREGRKLQPEIERKLLAFALDLEKQGKLKLDFKAMKIESL